MLLPTLESFFLVVFHIVKSLSFFEDAEHFADPIVFYQSVTWEKVKATINMAIKKLG